MQLAKGVREWCLGCPIPASHGMTDHALDVTYRSNEHPMLKSSPRYPRNIHVATECIDETRERYIKPGDITTPSLIHRHQNKKQKTKNKKQKTKNKQTNKQTMNRAKHLSSLSKSKYGHKDAILIEILKKLREAGAQADIELPTLVFCGNQSAGKSSLIEAIAGVPLPRYGCSPDTVVYDYPRIIRKITIAIIGRDMHEVPNGNPSYGLRRALALPGVREMGVRLGWTTTG
ncbi:hypothetical protein BC936DRAFT_140550 [Jimgerdemannia flammicorona]|uniref:P-loop containing nucleoside triphosphate hydrolase protein n=1 Tax=Jimgerdemannia flammicorona TaxID=994334 RepID=A0A433DGW7_9FUNG|nr:hypothetical protein BC936DRAFT_140550 [Jimgerdemannia flammicorona]